MDNKRPSAKLAWKSKGENTFLSSRNIFLQNRDSLQRNVKISLHNFLTYILASPIFFSCHISVLLENIRFSLALINIFLQGFVTFLVHIKR